MRRQTRFRHGKHFWVHPRKNVCGHVQSPSARTAGTRRVTTCVAVISTGVRFAAIKRFVKTQTAFRVFQRASLVLLLCLLSAALCMRRRTRFRHGRHFYNATASASGHAQSPNARTAGTRRVVVCAAAINEGVRFAGTRPRHLCVTRSNRGDLLSNPEECRGAPIQKRDVRCRSTCLFEKPIWIRILNTTSSLKLTAIGISSVFQRLVAAQTVQ